ncbi:MAG: hypothetical protein JXA46_11460 [Dehalococcoidales bacterium]|nr:hypothetical protein [Dehalococcoidales bacterium]
MAWVIGIDIGSGSSKGVIIRNGKIMADYLLSSRENYGEIARKIREALLIAAGIAAEEVAFTAATGHSAGGIPFSNLEISDLQCCARGIRSLFPSVRTIIDIQEQSSQAIKLDDSGRVIDLATDDTCASGSGYFLKVIANVLQIDLTDIGPLSLKSTSPVVFTTGCAVFGESEAISRVSEGIPKEDILAGVHRALAERVASLVKKIGLEEDCAISGGGGLNTGLVKAIEEQGIRLKVPAQPQMVNARGAALIGEERVK